MNRWPTVIPGTLREMAHARELLCPACRVELREITTDHVGGAQCPRCMVVYVWRWTPPPPEAPGPQGDGA